MKASQLAGLPIMSIREGFVQGTVIDTIIDPASRRVSHYILRKDSKYDLLILAAQDVKGAGTSFLIVPDGSAVKRIYAEPSRMEVVTRGFYLADAAAVSDTGETMGAVDDFEFDPQTGELMSLTVDSGDSYPAQEIVALSGTTVFLRSGSGPQNRTLGAPEPPASSETVPEPDAHRRVYEPEQALIEDHVQRNNAGPNGAITQKYFRNLLIGKTLGDDITSDDGVFRMEKGTVVTEWHMQLAEQHDAVSLIMKHIEPI